MSGSSLFVLWMLCAIIVTVIVGIGSILAVATRRLGWLMRPLNKERYFVTLEFLARGTETVRVAAGFRA